MASHRTFIPLPGVLRRARNAAVWILAAALTLLPGCSLVRYGYDHADLLAHYWASRYVTLDDDQVWLLRDQARVLLEWHRTTQLPHEIMLMNELSHRLQRTEPVTADEVQAVNQRLLVTLRTIAAQAAPGLAEIALTLKPGQLDEMERRFARRSRDFEKKYLGGTPDQQRRRTHERILDRAEFWFGRFDGAQRAAIRAAIDARPMHYELWVEEREARQRQLLKVLRRIERDKPDRAAATAWIAAWLASLEASVDPGREAHFVELRRSTAELTAFIVNQANDEQKAHAVKRLQGWIRIFEAVVARA